MKNSALNTLIIISMLGTTCTFAQPREGDEKWEDELEVLQVLFNQGINVNHGHDSVFLELKEDGTFVQHNMTFGIDYASGDYSKDVWKDLITFSFNINDIYIENREFRIEDRQIWYNCKSGECVQLRMRASRAGDRMSDHFYINCVGPDPQLMPKTRVKWERFITVARFEFRQ